MSPKSSVRSNKQAREAVVFFSQLVGLFFISSKEAMKDIFGNRDREAECPPQPSSSGMCTSSSLYSSLVNILDEAMHSFLFVSKNRTNSSRYNCFSHQSYTWARLWTLTNNTIYWMPLYATPSACLISPDYPNNLLIQVRTPHSIRRGIWDAIWLCHIPKATCFISSTTEMGHLDGHNCKKNL